METDPKKYNTNSLILTFVNVLYLTWCDAVKMEDVAI